jgi:hypothetical protein
VSTCIHCDAKLGENQLLPEYPVGKRLAFDPGNARIWAICPRCERWNLSHLDEPERQHAVARLDQYFSATSHKAAISGIAVGEVGKTKLVRIGDVSWPTFAGWRYAHRLHGRRIRGNVISAMFTAFVLYIYTPLGAHLRYSWISDVVTGAIVIWIITTYRQFHLLKKAGKLQVAENATPQSIAISIDESGWRLFGQHAWGEVQLDGAAAKRLLAMQLPIIAQGAKREVAEQAIEVIQRAGGPTPYLDRTISASGLGVGLHRVASLPAVTMAALEIALNEEHERAALRGELAAVGLEHVSARSVAAEVRQLG